MQNDLEQQHKLKACRRLGRLTVLELMLFLAILGGLATWILRHFW
jgi:hypothetical protein